jgi:acyl-CoA thioesterase YciA
MTEPARPDPDRADPDQPPAIEPALRTLAMPGDANPNGDIFGGWVLAQMDLAGSVPATERAQGRIATVAMDAVRFHKPVYIGDLVTIYAWIDRVGSSSITVRTETWATRQRQHAQRVRVTEGTLVYVAIDEAGNKRAVPPAAGGVEV